MSSLLGFRSPSLDSLNRIRLLNIFWVTNTKHDPKAQANPTKLLENVKEQARMTPSVNGNNEI